MIKNILIEGIDGGGKSTLAKELKNRLGWDHKALGHRGGDQFDRYLSEYAQCSQTVIERGHISEVVYSQIFGRTQPFTPLQQTILNSIICEQMIIIYAAPNLELAKSRLHDRPGVHQVVNVAQLEKMIGYFDEFIAKLPSSSRIATYRGQNWDELEQLVAAIKAELSHDSIRT
ncbi:MAG TPA: hypothetical protein VLF21_02025 [Candidatus Saccharimonadales bacterium]|nr:hypothetical protein [Candidatus Saccharimonadales bacterium]